MTARLGPPNTTRFPRTDRCSPSPTRSHLHRRVQGYKRRAFEPPVSGGNTPQPALRTLTNITRNPTSRFAGREHGPHTERPTNPSDFRYRCPAYGMLGIAPVRNRCTRVTANLAPRGVHRDLFVGVGHRADSADHHRPQGQPRHHRGLGRSACFSWCSLGRLRHGPSGTDPHRPRERLRVSARRSGHHS